MLLAVEFNAFGGGKFNALGRLVFKPNFAVFIIFSEYVGVFFVENIFSGNYELFVNKTAFYLYYRTIVGKIAQSVVQIAQRGA